ncbi:MAG: RNase adapter RapZ [Endomicrobiaceae bacterium]|nr:RNase adapter RapZ [Endomicrobiaceae bacterium]
MKNNFLIISGISGAGKSKVLNILEDFGFICIDNMPMDFIFKFIDLCKKDKKKYKNVALSIDIRSGKNISKISDILKKLKQLKIRNEIFFLDADDSTLVKRYSETRRKHPLGTMVKEAIAQERKKLEIIKNLASHQINTTDMTIGELKNRLAYLIGISLDDRQLFLTLMSFGFKYGIAQEADIVFDVRFISNPNYVSRLKMKTGKDSTVVKYIEKQKEYNTFFNKISNLLKFLLPSYIREGKSQLTIAIGCTGGRHRSVATAEKLSKFFIKNKYKVAVYHRDISKAG